MLIEIGDPDFRHAHPDVSAEEAAAYEDLVHAYEARVRAGELPDHAAYAAAPYGYAEAVAYSRRSPSVIRASAIRASAIRASAVRAAATPSASAVPAAPGARRSA